MRALAKKVHIKGLMSRFQTLALCLMLLEAYQGAVIGWAADEPVFTIEFKDGKVAPERLEVPANQRFQLQLVNSGETPAEFESNELHKEKVLAPKSSSILVFRTLDPGEYPFFDDFHPDAPKAVLVAK